MFFGTTPSSRTSLLSPAQTMSSVSRTRTLAVVDALLPPLVVGGVGRGAKYEGPSGEGVLPSANGGGAVVKDEERRKTEERPLVVDLERSGELSMAVGSGREGE